MQSDNARWIWNLCDKLFASNQLWAIYWGFQVPRRIGQSFTQRDASLISKWSFKFFHVHHALLCRKWKKNIWFASFSSLNGFFFNNFFFSLHHTLDLPTITDDMEGIKAMQTFYTVFISNDDMVYMYVPYFRLQTSLVWCAGWCNDWCNICHCCCKLKFCCESFWVFFLANFNENHWISSI